MAEVIVETPSVDNLVGALTGARRRSRQEAAHQLALMAHQDAHQLLPYVDELVDALYRPEAQTRWEVFDALGELCLIDPEAVAKGYDGAEASLFDEGSATVRLAAFRFLCRLGASSPARSDASWPLLDEAIQCYHGDPEYHDMLLALLEFARGDLSENTRDALIARISFDTTNSQAYIKAFSTQIVAAAKGGE
ncbi:MAG: hypothetical protein IKG11_02500 [Atopobiaceae bacterium]|nr:hypothetical protein [Atopobiaceae bacterium]MDO4403879.1 hypothetical protein [Atopobiaceae bacterium]